MSITRFSILVLLFVSFQACKTSSLPASTPIKEIRKPQAVDFTILQLNDVYEIAPLEGGKAGGLARVASLRQELLKENPNVITVISGDFLSPSLIANLNLENNEKIAGLQMIETLNALGVDYATFGNHEFDNRDSALLAKRLNQCNFRFVTSNVRRIYTGGNIAPFRQIRNGQTQEVPEYVVHEFKNKTGDAVKIALTGVLLPFTKRPYVHYLPLEDSFRSTVNKAKSNSDMVVAMTHIAAADDQALAKAVPGVALFMGGHDHDAQSYYVENTVITKADANAKTVYIHRCRFDPESKMYQIRSTLKTIDPSLANEPNTQAVIEKWIAKVDQTLRSNGYQPEMKLTDLKEPLECKEVDIRSRQTNFGALTVTAMEYVAPGADAYLINSGSMRLDDNLSGSITQYDIVRTFPFGGGFAQMDLPGAEVKKVLTAGLETNRGEGGYLQVGKVSKINGQWALSGKIIEDKQTYKVVLSAFVAGGSEANLNFLSQFKPNEPKSYTLFNGKTIKNDVRDIMIAYLTK
jgi:5'-nucleotidase